MNNVGKVIHSVHYNMPDLDVGEIRSLRTKIPKMYAHKSNFEQRHLLNNGIRYIEDGDAIVLKTIIDCSFSKLESYIKAINECEYENEGLSHFPLILNSAHRNKETYGMFFFDDDIFAFGPSYRSSFYTSRPFYWTSEGPLGSNAFFINDFYNQNKKYQNAMNKQTSETSTNFHLYRTEKGHMKDDPCDVYLEYIDYIKNNIRMVGDWNDGWSTENDISRNQEV